MDINKEKKSSAYNLNEATILLIAELQKEAFAYMNENYVDQAFNRIQQIRILIENRFEDDELQELDTLEARYNLKGFTNEFKDNFIQKNKKYYSGSEINKIECAQKDFHKKMLSLKKKRLVAFIKKIMKLMRVYKIDLGDLEKRDRIN